MEPCSPHVKNIRYNLKFEILYPKLVRGELVRGLYRLLAIFIPLYRPEPLELKVGGFFDLPKNCKKSIFDQV